MTLGESLSSVVAVLRGRAPVSGERPVVLLRGDMDALPVTEEVDVDYVSQRPGLMHACGHDLHVAGLVGAARILHELRDELVGDVVLMFQPAEEGPGGAEPMIREGLLDAAGRRVDAAYAVHVYAADHPFGTWFGRPGTLMAAADEVMIRVHGLGGHGAAPERTRDPVPVACEIVLAFQTRGHPAVQRVGPGGAHRRPDRRGHGEQRHPRRRRTSRRRCAPSRPSTAPRRTRS